MPKPPSKPQGGTAVKTAPQKTVKVSKGVVTNLGEKIGIYGGGGQGKTSLVAAVQNLGIEVLYIDLDQGSLGLDVARAINEDGHLVSTLDEVRAVLQNHELIKEFGMVCIDSFSALEERIKDWVIENIPIDSKGTKAKSIESYGFGKGFVHIWETALKVLGDLDAISRLGVHVCLVCHQVAEKVPSAESEDYLEYQPRLQSPPKTAKLRERVFEWTNHFFRLDMDRDVTDGKAEINKSRAIYTERSTTAWAKHRKLPNGREFPQVIPFPKGSDELWQIMFG